MSPEGLLAFLAVCIGFYAAASPVQRESVKQFVPLWLIALPLTVSMVLVFFQRWISAVAPSWHLLEFCLGLASFGILVLALVFAWLLWEHAYLGSKPDCRIERILRVAALESKYAEAERVLIKNRDQVITLSGDAQNRIFETDLVSGFLEAHSWFHLDLIKDQKALNRLADGRRAVYQVLRAMLLTDGLSPISSFVAERSGGDEVTLPSQRELDFVDGTFGDSSWYIGSNAHYPLTITAIELLRSGRFDEGYNQLGGAYEATQGISERARCPVYAVVVVETHAIIEAIEARSEGDLYVTDLWDLFAAVSSRSSFEASIWESPEANWEYPTPFAYLLSSICSTLRQVYLKCLEKSTHKSYGPWVVDPPHATAVQAAKAWSFCAWNLCYHRSTSGEEFRKNLVRTYLESTVMLGWQVERAFNSVPNRPVGGINVWRDLLADELSQRFFPTAAKRELRAAHQDVDNGLYAGPAKEWLAERLNLD